MLVGILLGIASRSAHAVTKTWDGSSSTSWNVAANWSPSGVPGSSDDVLLLDSPYNVALVMDLTTSVN